MKATILNLPWVEKYRPKRLDDLVSHVDIISTIQRFVNEGKLPHLLFYGPPGTGKTSTILACAQHLYTPKQFQSMVLELNASDDRGINVVREQILSFASTKTIFSHGFKLIILDEADAMTREAQDALRRIVEEYTQNVRFCLICNQVSKIIPALQSRCSRFRFAPLLHDQMTSRINFVVQEENVIMTADGLKALVTLSQGDMRRALNILQSTWMSQGLVDEENVYLCVGHPLKKDIHFILDSMLNRPLSDAYSVISSLQIAKGLALADIVSEIHSILPRLELPNHVRIMLLIKMADVEYRLCSGTSEKLQLGSLLSAFFKARQMCASLAQTSVEEPNGVEVC